MSSTDRQLLSLGVFLIIVVVGILLAFTSLIGWGFVVPVVLVLSGIWVIALSGIRSMAPQKYERGAFSTAAAGLGLIVIGGAWYLAGINWILALVLVLLAIAIVAIAAALKRK